MKRFKTINKYRESVFNIVKKEKIIPQINIEKNIDPSHHTIVIPCLLPNYDGQWLLRILITSDKKKNQSFIKETKLLKVLKKYKKEFNKIPNIVKANLITKPKWIIRQYFLGLQVGNFWSFDNLFLTNNNSKILINYLTSLQNKSQKINRDFKKINKSKSLPVRGSAWFINNWKKDLDYNPDFYYQKFIKTYFTIKERKKIDTIFNSNKKLLNKYAKYLNHGDLMPQNILIDKNNNLFFIDWEEAHLNNPMFDVSYIYVNSWNNKKWRENFLKSFIKNNPEPNKNDLKILADINTILIALRMAQYAHLNKIHHNKKINMALNAHLLTIKKIINK